MSTYETAGAAEKPAVAAAPAGVVEPATSADPAPAPAADPPSDTGNIVTDAEDDANDLKSQAFTAAKAEVDNAFSAGQKLLATAAGDVPELLTDGESAAVTFLVSKVPTSIASEVNGFLQTAAGAAVSATAISANAAVAKGLAYALAELKSIQGHLDSFL